MKKNKVFRLSLGWQIILGLVIGVILGVVFADNKKFIAFANGLGSTFINMISMIVLPIVVSWLYVATITDILSSVIFLFLLFYINEYAEFVYVEKWHGGVFAAEILSYEIFTGIKE